MAVPDYQSLMLPLLRLAYDKKAKTLAEAEGLLCEEFGLSEADRSQRLPSKQQTVIRNRVGWASFYLKSAGLLEKPKRGVFYITDQGRQVVASGTASIDIPFLMKFEAFRQFYTKGASSGEQIESTPASPSPSDKTPDEVLQAAYASLRQELAADILDRLIKTSPDFFETIVVELLVAMGYGGSLQDAGQKLGKSGDGGVDGIIKEDRLGLDVIFVQAKRWQDKVGRPEIQKFVGALQGQRARKGVFMTTSGFSADAVDYVTKIETKVVLLDGIQIAELMIDHNVGVSPVSTFIVKRVDSDYFDEGQ